MGQRTDGQAGAHQTGFPGVTRRILEKELAVVA
jgi:hypothetical protein